MRKLLISFIFNLIFLNSVSGTSINLYENLWWLDNSSSNVSIMLPDEKINLRKTPVVAVIDFGIQFDHPEILNSLHRNESECSGLEGVDDDKNGYVDDCHGLNIASKYSENLHGIDSPVRKRDALRGLGDIDGHGTHIAGIIAGSDDQKGIKGIDDRIKVLPIKIFNGTSTPFKVKNDHPYSISSMMVEAIDYAILRKVDVINISAGWLNRMHTNKIEEALLRAKKENILIVSAAGNNANNSNQYPCSLVGVVCVGSLNKSGAISKFSNQGGMVDIYAPGEDILSSIPEGFPLKKFSINGYDKMSGTSQAAPMVSAAAALIKGVFPTITTDDILRRLLDGATVFKMGDTQVRALNIGRALKTKLAPSVWPELKRKSLLEIKDHAVSTDLLIKNLGSNSGDLRVYCDVEESGVSLDECSLDKRSLKRGETTKLKVKMSLKGLEINNKVVLKLKIKNNQTEKTFSKQFFIVRSFKQVKKVELKIPRSINSFEKLYPVTNINKGQNNYFVNLLKTSSSLKLEFYKIIRNSLTKVTTIVVNNKKKVLGLYRDKAQLAVLTSENTDKQKILEAHMFSTETKENSTVFGIFDKRVKINLKQVFFVKDSNNLVTNFGLKAIAELNANEYDEDSWSKTYLDINFAYRGIGDHIFFLTSKGKKTFDNENFYNKFYNQKKLEWGEKLWFSDTPVTMDNESVLMTHTSTNQNFVIDLKDGKKVSKISEPNFELSGPNVKQFRFLDLKNKTQSTIFSKSNTDKIFSIYELDSGSNYSFRSDDKILSLVAGYRNNSDSSLVFFESKQYLNLLNLDKGSVPLKLRLDRFSFFKNLAKKLKSLYFFGSTKVDGELVPAVFSDSSKYNNNFISSAIYTKGEFKKPIKYTFEIPKNCATITPLRVEKEISIPVLCRKGKREQILLVNPY